MKIFPNSLLARMHALIAPKVVARFMVLIVALFVQSNMAGAYAADASAAASLRVKYDGLRAQLANNQFNKPLYLDSSEMPGGLDGDIYGVVDYPYAVVEKALKQAPDWCDVMILHLNVKYCEASKGKSENILSVFVGKKHPQSIKSAFRIDYIYRVAATSTGYFQIVLTADKGPVGTKNYRIILEAIPLDGAKTFIHVRYAYSHGIAAKIAMRSYLSTLGHGKAGFTIIERQADGSPVYVSSLRGAVERNTMRYYMAIDAYLGALGASPQGRLEKRLRDWFAFTEQYSHQLHEIESGEYMSMKREEYRRQQRQ